MKKSKIKQTGHSYTPRVIEKLTPEQWAELETMVADAQKQFPAWRLGQTYFNVLFTNYPELGDWVRGTAIDPFYVDERIPAFKSNVTKTE